MIVENLNRFSLKAFSRHPRFFGEELINKPPSYDAETHRYNPNYVNPSSWTIAATAQDALINPMCGFKH